MNNKITTAQIINQDIDCQIRFPSDKAKFGSLYLDGCDTVHIKFTCETCVRDAVTMYGASLSFGMFSEIYRAIKKIEDLLEQDNVVNRRVKMGKDLLFAPLDECCEVYDENKQRVPFEDVKAQSVHSGFIRVKWAYRNPTTHEVSLKIAVVCTKFKTVEPISLLDDL